MSACVPGTHSGLDHPANRERGASSTLSPLDVVHVPGVDHALGYTRERGVGWDLKQPREKCGHSVGINQTSDFRYKMSVLRPSYTHIFTVN